MIAVFKDRNMNGVILGGTEIIVDRVPNINELVIVDGIKKYNVVNVITEFYGSQQNFTIILDKLN